MTVALILAAGMSSRLLQLSTLRPKPLLPVANETLLNWAVRLCVRAGLTEQAVNLHHLGEMIRAQLKDGAALGARVQYSEEPEILGTGGGIKKMAELFTPQTVVAINAKIVVDLDLTAVLDFHREQGALATMVLAPVANAEQWGAIGIDQRGQLTRLLDEQRLGPGPTMNYMFTGIHVLEPELLKAIPSGSCCIIRTAYTQLFKQGAPLAGYVHRGYFFEHSTPARYLQGNFNLLDDKVHPAHFLGPFQGVHPTAYVAESAKIIPPVLIGPGAEIEDGAEVGPYVVLGARAVVAADVRLQHCVVWPEIFVNQSASDAVITEHGLVLAERSAAALASPRGS